MEVLNFRIKNYKSIKDSGLCYLSEDNITVLAGKNESGKTSILEALEDFNTNKKIREDAKPISDSEETEIIITFRIDNSKLNEISDKFNLEGKYTEITIKKDYENNYEIVETKKDIFGYILNRKMKLELKNSEIFEKIQEIFENNGFSLVKSYSIEEDDISSLIKDSKEKINNETDIGKINSMEEEMINNRAEFFDLENILASYNTKILEAIPNFILFNTYEDQNIPNEIQYKNLEDSEFVRDLVEISNLDLNLIKDPSKSREQATHKKKLNINLVEEYRKFWIQDLSNIEIDWKDNKLFFWVVENDEFYPPKFRSKGKQWHLAFYIKVTARAKENKKNILLIDEPGLFLHAKAQKDILNKMEEASKEIQIIYSTHSPYLIDSNYLNRVRLVEKETNTKILKLHAKADKETITPILTAIGDDLSQGIRVDKENSFIVEGISDYFYINAFRVLFDLKDEIFLIPGCGDNLTGVGGILFGWGVNPKFILDSDKESLIKKIKEKLSIEEYNVISILESKGVIENIFSENDFKRLVLEDENTDLTKNFIKEIKNKGGKELISRRFYEKVNNGIIKKEHLDSESTERIQILISKIKKLISKN